MTHGAESQPPSQLLHELPLSVSRGSRGWSLHLWTVSEPLVYKRTAHTAIFLCCTPMCLTWCHANIFKVVRGLQRRGNTKSDHNHTSKDSFNVSVRARGTEDHIRHRNKDTSHIRHIYHHQSMTYTLVYHHNVLIRVNILHLKILLQSL